ncbi:MAG: MFS transporter [Novosphingobium sp.]
MDDRATGLAEWKRYWPLAFVSTAGLTFSPIPTYSLGLVMEPLKQAFGWGYAEVSYGMWVVSIFAILFSSPVGALIDRFGARRVALPGMLFGMVAISSMSLANGSLWQWAALWLLYASASLFIKTTVWCAAVSKAFFASRGLALGVVLCGTGLSQTFTPKIAQVLIDDYGWRAAYQILGLGWGGFLFVLLFLFFHEPQAAAAPAQSGETAAPQSRNAALPGYSFGEAMRTQQVLRVIGAVAASSIVGVGVTLHLVPILGEAGMARGDAAWLMVLFGLCMIAGKLVNGVLLDRIQGNVIPFVSFALPAVGMGLLLAQTHSTLVAALAVAIMGYAAGATTQISAYLITRYGGLKSFGALLGINSSVIGLAMGFGTWFAGKVFDVTGSYQLVLSIAIPLAVFAGLLVVGLGAYPDFAGRKEPELSPA